MTDALTLSLRLLRLQLVAVETSKDSFADCVRYILIKVEILAHGHERLGGALNFLPETMIVGFKEIINGTQQTSVGAEGRVIDARHEVDQTLALIDRVKAVFCEDEMMRILQAPRSGEVCIDTGRTSLRLIEVVADVRGADRNAARDRQLSTVRLPARCDAHVLVGMRACEPILLSKPHHMKTLRDILCNVFFKGISINREDLTNDLSRLWMDDNQRLHDV